VANVVRELAVIKGWLAGLFRSDPLGTVPPHPIDWREKFEQAVAMHRQGHLSDAKHAYVEILEIFPDNFDVLHLCGVVEYQVGRFSEAADLIGKAIAKDPDQAPAYSNLGLVLLNLGRVQDALGNFDRALILQPEYAEALFNRGNAYRQLGRFQEALDSYARATESRPAYLEAMNNEGLVLVDLNRSAEALSCFEKALQIAPDSADALANRAATLCGLNRNEEALADLEKLVALYPERAEAHYYSIACVLAIVGDPKSALASFDRVISLNPASAEALNGRGSALRDLGRHQEALSSYDLALEVKPDFPEALDNRGTVLANLGRHDEALESHERALVLRPGFPQALVNRASVLRETGSRLAALDGYWEAIEADPTSLVTRFKSLVARVPVLATDIGEIEHSRSEFQEELQVLEAWSFLRAHGDEHKAVGAIQPFHLAYQEENNRDLLARYGALCSTLMERWRQRAGGIRLTSRPQRGGLPMRVGIVSAHIRNHSVWNAIVKGWLERIDSTEIEFEVFHLGATQDEETEFAKAHCARFHSGVRSLESWAKSISERDLDALIYPEVGMDAMTVRLASMRLAPTQMGAWGHPETTGLPTIDYYLSAECFEGPQSPQCYTEKLVPLPNLGCYYGYEVVEPAQSDLRDPELPVFICPGTPFKYAPQHDEVFVEIAQRVGNSQFVFFTYLLVPLLSQRLEKRLAKVFDDAGLDSSKFVKFVPWQPKPEFYFLLGRANVYLDTIGFSGFNTVMQAIECGLPIVTCEGRFMRGKFGSAILKRIGLGELVANSDESYAAIASRLALEPAFNAQAREKILTKRQVLFCDGAPIDALQKFLVGLRA